MRFPPAVIWVRLLSAFFRPFGAYNACIGDSSICWHLVFMDEEDCVGAFYAAFEALGEAPIFICTGDEPFILVVGVGDEVSILKLSSSFEMGNSKTFVDCCL